MPSASWREQRVNGHTYILVFLLSSKPFDMSLSMIAPERLLRLFFETFHNPQFNMTNTQRISLTPDMMLKSGMQISLVPSYFQGLIYQNLVW